MSDALSFWQNKRVLITGHTGFKGSWLVVWLQRLGAEITGIALPPATQPNLCELTQRAQPIDSHYCDIRDAARLKTQVHSCQPEIVIHLAAQPLVRASYRDPLATLATNIQGTAHLLDALRGLASVRVAVMVTTDKVYRNREQPYPYREEDVLGGHDPYSASKAASELVIASYREAFLREQGVAVASARAGNVIGGGDWSEDRLIPDAVRAWSQQQPLLVRRPDAIRPWQHVLEPLSGYLRLAERLWDDPNLAGAYNFGPYPHEAATVREVVERARQVYGQGEVHYGEGCDGPHEAGWLALESAKSRHILGVHPRWTLHTHIQRTLDGYRQWSLGASAIDLCNQDCKDFVQAANAVECCASAT